MQKDWNHKIVSVILYLEIECQDKPAGIFSPCDMVNIPHIVTQFNPVFFPSSPACVVDFFL